VLESPRDNVCWHGREVGRGIPGLTEDMKNVAYYPSGGAPCECWINADWVGSKAFAGESCGLADMLLFLPEPSG